MKVFSVHLSVDLRESVLVLLRLTSISSLFPSNPVSQVSISSNYNLDEFTLSSFIENETASVAKLFQCTSMETDVLIQIWLHFSIFHSHYNLTPENGIKDVFQFYSHLKAFSNTNSQPESSGAMTLFIQLCMELVRIVLTHYQESDMERNTLQEGSHEKLISNFFDYIHINQSLVNQSNWSYIAWYIFQNYYHEPDFCTSSSLYQTINTAFHSLMEQDGCPLNVPGEQLIFIMFGLTEMANQSFTVICIF